MTYASNWSVGKQHKHYQLPKCLQRQSGFKKLNWTTLIRDVQRFKICSLQRRILTLYAEYGSMSKSTWSLLPSDRPYRTTLFLLDSPGSHPPPPAKAESIDWTTCASTHNLVLPDIWQQNSNTFYFLVVSSVCLVWCGYCKYTSPCSSRPCFNVTQSNLTFVSHPITLTAVES